MNEITAYPLGRDRYTFSVPLREIHRFLRTLKHMIICIKRWADLDGNTYVEIIVNVRDDFDIALLRAMGVRVLSKAEQKEMCKDILEVAEFFNRTKGLYGDWYGRL